VRAGIAAELVISQVKNTASWLCSDPRAAPATRSAGAAVLLLLVVLLAACASRPRSTTADGPGGTSVSGEAMTTPDAGGVRACIHDAKDIAPCTEDCDRGIASACATLAARMERGTGIPRDLTRAATLHERACELRDPGSCVLAARMHASGTGVTPNRTKQMELLVAACTLGDASACSVAAKAFAAGAGVNRDQTRAHELWERACTGGIETACDALSDGGV
jgi:hypothetical protein